MKFPKVKNIAPKSIADDIFPYIPGDEENMKIWEEQQKALISKIKKDFDDKGIPLPKIEVDYSKKPISEDDHPLMK